MLSDCIHFIFLAITTAFHVSEYAVFAVLVIVRYSALHPTRPLTWVDLYLSCK